MLGRLVCGCGRGATAKVLLYFSNFTACVAVWDFYRPIERNYYIEENEYDLILDIDGFWRIPCFIKQN